MDLSPGWHALGQEVRISFSADMQWLNISCRQKRPLVPSMGISRPGMADWIEGAWATFALAAAAQSITSPLSYQSGRAALEAHREYVLAVPDFMAAWALPFTALSVIANRSSPWHRDTKAPLSASDLLITLGGNKPDRLCSEGRRNGRMHLPGIGIYLDYASGSIMSINSKLVRHSVSESENERLCLAFFLRESVLDALGVAKPEWSKWNGDDIGCVWEKALERGKQLVGESRK